MRRFAFSQIEILTAILILAIIAGTFSLSVNIGKLTPKQEAEKIAAKIIDMTREAIRRRESFSMTIANDKTQINFHWETANENDKFTADKDFLFSWNVPNDKLTYSHVDNDFSNQGGTLTVERSDAKKYYVVIAVHGGRVRASPTPGSGKNQDDDETTQ